MTTANAKDYLPPEQPANFHEWLWFIRHHESAIFVRENNDQGKWDSVSLSELTPNRWAHHVNRWYEEGMRIPCYVREVLP